MARCPSCDHENPPDLRNCERCGADLLPSSNATPPSQELTERVRALLTDRRKIEAIKLYRERTGVGLKEAKDAVDALGTKHGLTGSQGSGCLGVVALFAALAAAMGLGS